MNIFCLAKGEPRFSNIDKDSWNMILGKMGKLPGELAPEIIKAVKDKGMTFYTGNPQDAYPDALPEYRAEMKANGWDLGQDDEELFELAMHDRQYRDYKSGIAKERFKVELELAKEKAGAPKFITRPVIEVPSFDVESVQKNHPAALPVQAPCSGQIVWQVDVVDASLPPVVGTTVKAADPVCWVQTYYGLEPVFSGIDGKLIQLEVSQGKNVQKNQVLAFVEP